MKISASILNANFAILGEETKSVLNAGCDMIHFDVMDNHYVPNLTMGPAFCSALRDYGIKAPIDVHLMTKPVDSLINAFAKAGANIITIHPEATDHLDRSLQLIKNVGCQSGLALNPATPLCYLEYILDKLDLVLIMSVNPGFGSQEFILSALEKIEQTKTLIKKHNKKINISVDGGINIHNIKTIAKAGADIAVVGSAIFKSNEPYKNTIEKLKS